MGFYFVLFFLNGFLKQRMSRISFSDCSVYHAQTVSRPTKTCHTTIESMLSDILASKLASSLVDLQNILNVIVCACIIVANTVERLSFCTFFNKNFTDM